LGLSKPKEPTGIAPDDDRKRRERKDVEDVFGERVLFSNNLLTALILVHLLRRRHHDSSIEMSDPAVYKPEKQPASVKWQPSIHRFSMVLLWARQERLQVAAVEISDEKARWHYERALFITKRPNVFLLFALELVHFQEICLDTIDP
jgi:hypothetical protein